MPMASAPDEMPVRRHAAAGVPRPSTPISSVVPVILPGGFELAGQPRFGGSEIAHGQRPPRDRRGSPPLARSPPTSAARPLFSRCDRFRPLPRRVAARLSRPSSPSPRRWLGSPAGNRDHAIGGERGGVAVDRGAAGPAQGCPGTAPDPLPQKRREVGEPQRGVNASPVTGC